jgi:gliding motility-associated-like protein
MKRVTLLCTILGFLAVAGTAHAGTIFPVDTLFAGTLNCSGSTSLCIGIPAGDLPGYTVTKNGAPYAGSIAGCDYDTTIAYTYNTLWGLGNMGPYQLNSWTVNGQTHAGIFENIGQLVNLLNEWDPQGDWIHEPSTLSIKGGKSGSNYSPMQVTVMSNQTPSTIGLNLGLLPQGSEMDFAAGVHTVVAEELSTGKKDTLVVIVECLQLPPPLTIYDTIQADGLPYVVCLDNDGLPGNPASMTNVCPALSGEFVSFYLDTLNFCVKYQGIKCGGQDTACIVACDDMGVCDTTYFIVNVDFTLCNRHSQKMNDTIFVNFTETYCLDTTGLPGTIVSVTNLCPGGSGESVEFIYDFATHCVTYTGIEPGSGQACFLLADAQGNLDTAYVCVFVMLPETGIIIDTVLLGQNETYCFDTSELAGNVVSIENFCPALSGNSVNFALDDVNLCVEATGLTIGTDTACVAICDDFGVCDTTYVIIAVVPDTGDPCSNALPPVALDDSATTALNTPVSIDILSNDTLGNCVPVTVALLDESGPLHGLASLNVNQTVDYLPETDFCGADSFLYVLCSPVGCDTAAVFVTVACAPLDTIIIYNGFSPNGDTKNDFFKIENIELFPDSDLKVFNRWGNLVFQTTGYQNDWDGSFNGKQLPDGTYFYRLDLDGKRQFTGFLQLHR